MDKLAGLTAFKRVVEDGSFAAAARRLGLSRSQVNRAVINLEDALGVQLLNRTTRTVTTTATGRAFYARVAGVLDDLAEAERAVQSVHDEPQGEIRLNAPMSFGTLHLGKALAAFMTRYPAIRIQAELSDRFVDPVADGFDMTIRVAARRSTPSLIDHEIVEAKRVICASPAFLAAHPPPVDATALTALPCLHYGDLTGGNTWVLDGPDGRVQVKVNGILCSNNAEVLRDAAVAGLGVALLPTFIAGAALQAGELVSILPGYRPPAIYLTLLYPPNRHLATRIRLFVRFIQDWFGDRPYWDLVD